MNENNSNRSIVENSSKIIVQGLSTKKKNKINEKDFINNICDINNKIKFNEKIDNDLNDEEMNTLDYEKALIIDKRTFFQYYISLIKRKNIIIFTFIPINDYNLIYMKIWVFLISISLYFVVNALFFTDETMHKIYKDKGAFNFIYQLPKIIYSTIISAVINILIKKLALTEPDIICHKNKKEEEIEEEKIKIIK